MRSRTASPQMDPSTDSSGKERQRVVVILPAYNEDVTIRSTIGSFHASLPGARIHVVNNNSRDATGKVAEATLRERGIDGAVFNEPRHGKGNAVRWAFMTRKDPQSERGQA